MHPRPQLQIKIYLSLQKANRSVLRYISYQKQEFRNELVIYSEFQHIISAIVSYVIYSTEFIATVFGRNNVHLHSLFINWIPVSKR